MQLLLRKLPHKSSTKDNFNSIHTIDDDNIIIPDTKITPQHITQYNIPKDPNVYVPKFKPIKSSITSTYTFQLGPIEEITKHTYGTGHHLDDQTGQNPDRIIRKSISGPTLQTNLVPPIKEPISSIFKSNQIPKTQSQYSHSHTVDAPPLDLYHAMTIKNNQPKLTPSSYLQPPSLSSSSQSPPNPSQMQIYKSIEYQIQWKTKHTLTLYFDKTNFQICIRLWKLKKLNEMIRWMIERRYLVHIFVRKMYLCK